MATQTQAHLPPLDRERPPQTETALLALGCFWSPDAQFGALPGVVRTSSGYAGGAKSDPTYHALGDHTETVEVEFDPERISYGDLLTIFWESHDPTRRSWKRQYRSALFVLDAAQEKTARRSKEQRSSETSSRIRTAVEPVERFFLAERYHQNYHLRRSSALERFFEDRYPDAENFAHAPAASRVNGYIAGYGSEEQFEADIDRLGLSEALQKRLRQHYERGGGRSLWQRLFG